MVRNIIFACLIVLVLIFIVQNTQVVEFHFLMWTVSISRALMLFGTLAVGVVTGWFLARQTRKKKKHRKVSESHIMRWKGACDGRIQGAKDGNEG